MAPKYGTTSPIHRVAASKVSKSRDGRSATSMQYAQHGRDLVG